MPDTLGGSTNDKIIESCFPDAHSLVWGRGWGELETGIFITLHTL
jgi:hypothetical protein